MGEYLEEIGTTRALRDPQRATVLISTSNNPFFVVPLAFNCEQSAEHGGRQTNRVLRS